MEEIIEGLMNKVGLSEEKAQEVIAFLKEHADKLPALLGSSGIADKLPGGLGSMFGGGDD